MRDELVTEIEYPFHDLSLLFNDGNFKMQSVEILRVVVPIGVIDTLKTSI